MVHVLGRIHRKHPELEESDVLEAWSGAVLHVPRLDSRPFEYLVVGYDSRGRAIEMVARRPAEGDWVIWHAFTPPSARTLRELLRRG